ncbi:NHL repeat-containing protein [Streptomyces rimosus]|uniref:superoxide dismutase n=1 Tax=Streptomyces rimosus TaxID=1927 RepID=UPI000AD8C982|nr:superoxide dismutase [Streptomyces rimosus]
MAGPLALLGLARPAQAATPTSAAEGPATLQLPEGFRPDGIAIGAKPYAYFGSLNNGAIYKADLATGVGKVVASDTGGMATGMKLDGASRLYVAGGSVGDGRIVDTESGKVVADYKLPASSGFINDVVLTRDAAWFTDSFNPVLYKIPRHRDGSFPRQSEVVTVPLTGDLHYGQGFNVSGIAPTPQGNGLVIAQISTGKLFEVDLPSGITHEVNTGGEALTNPDGLLLIDHTLYIAQNRKNEVASLRLDDSGKAAKIVRRTTDNRFDIPTRIAVSGERLYLPNARTTTEPTPTTPYTAVAIPRG